MIKIIEIKDRANFPFILRIDEYVPLTFRSYEGPLGARYIRSGKSDTSLLEFIFSEESLLLRGITLVLFDKTHTPAPLPETKVVSGLPVLKLPEDVHFKGSVFQPYMDLNDLFTVGLGDDFLEIKFADTSKIDMIAQFEKLTFLTQKNTLCGIRLNNLNTEEMSVLAPFFTRLGN